MTKESLKQWYETVAQHMPHLSKPQAFVLALWSLGMVIARSCALTAVSCFLAKPLGVKENALRERLRDFYREASAKKGEKRAALLSELPLPLGHFYPHPWPSFSDLPAT